MRLPALLLTALLSGMAFGQGVSFQGPKIESQAGPTPIPGLTIGVCLDTSSGVPCTPTVSVFFDKALSLPITALQTDGDGQIPTFFISPGQYQWCASDPIQLRISAYCTKFTAPVVNGGAGSFSSLTVTGLSTLNNVLVGGTLGVAGVETDTNINGIRFANGFPGSGTTQINNAENDCGTNSCIVYIPSTVAAGAGQDEQSHDNIFTFDVRNFTASAQQQHTNLMFNVKDTANSGVRDKLMFVDVVNPALQMQAGNTSSSWYVHAFAEGNIQGYGTIEATNGTITVDTAATGTPSAVVGLEAECFVSGTVANTISSCRGGTYNIGLTGAGNITNGVAIQAQAATNTGSGTITNAIGLVAENQTVGTTNNLGIWNQGQQANDKPMSIGSLSNGTVPQTNTMLFVRPLTGDLTGGTQTGMQVAAVTSSGATATGIGVRARADTAAAAFTQALNQGLRVDTPSVGAGSTITEWDGLDIEAAPTAGTKCSIKLAGSTSGTTCINPTAVASGTITFPAATGTVALVSGTGTFSCVNVTPVTVNANTAADQTLMACTITAGTLNTVGKTLSIQGAGIYSTPAASSTTVNIKAKLCTVSGCGSGTVINLVSLTSAALGAIQATNDPFNFQLFVSTQTAGASAAFESHGNLTIDTAALTTAAEGVYADGNTATVGTIDSTAQLFLQITGAFSAASASNSMTNRQLTSESIN